jgi:hypothetical protein
VDDEVLFFSWKTIAKRAKTRKGSQRKKSLCVLCESSAAFAIFFSLLSGLYEAARTDTVSALVYKCQTLFFFFKALSSSDLRYFFHKFVRLMPYFAFF